jgi:hypothetical protein
MTEYIDVDVRPILRAGGEPFSVIMAAPLATFLTRSMRARMPGSWVERMA